jgi:Holliday junction resolvase RusA-like endonuclease
MKMTFYVHDRPAPQGSKRIYPNGGMKESSPGLGNWRAAVVHAALNAKGDIGSGVIFPKPMPLRLSITFHFKRPKNHYRTGKFQDQLKPDAPHYMAQMPDLSKLIRATEDAITQAAVWTDDAQVVMIHAHQVYNDNADEGAAITIMEARPVK